MKPLKLIAQVEIPRDAFEAHVRGSIWEDLYPDLKDWSDLNLTPDEEQAIYTCAEGLFEEAAEDALSNWGDLYDDQTLVLNLLDRAEVFKRRVNALLEANRGVKVWAEGLDEDERAIERLKSRGYKVEKI
jgi:hypothetical protein